MNCKVCANTSANNNSVSFFRFPKEHIRCKEWAERCNLENSHEKYGTLRFYKSFRICSDHFDSKDIIFDGRKKRLTQSAVPKFFPTNQTTSKTEIKESQYFADRKLNLVKNLCRLCAKERKNLTDIFGYKGKKLNLEDKLKYFPLVMSKCDILPLKICYPCISKINEVHDFITSCITAEIKLRIMLELKDCATVIEPNEIKENSNSNSETGADSTGNTTLDWDNFAGVVICFPNYPANNFVEADSSNQPNPVTSTEKNQPEVGKNDFFTRSPEINPPEINQSSKVLNYTNYVKEVDFSKTVSRDHYYSNSVLRNQFSSNQTLQDENQNVTKYSCDVCFESENMEELNVQMKSDPFDLNPNKEFGPETSEDVYTNRYLSSKHVNLTEENFIKCQICDKNFHKVAFLDEHLEKFHKISSNQSRPFQSEVTEPNIRKFCLESPNLETNDEHKNRLLPHPNPRKNSDNPKFCQKSELRHKCQFCDKKFKNRQACSKHERSHAGKTPQECKLCGKTFRSKSSLRQHKSVHSDKRLFSCQECGMSFKRKDTLGNHLRIHTGERPFVCKICGFAFKQRGDCVKHEKNHERINEMKFCDVIQLLDSDVHGMKDLIS